MSNSIYKSRISEEINKFKEIKPELHEAWVNYHNSVFKDGALSKKEKELTAVALAHVTMCPYCIRGRVLNSKKLGASDEEIVEAIYVGMRFAMGAPFAYSSIAFETVSALDKNLPLTEGHFFKKDISHEITHFREVSGDMASAFSDFTKKIFADGALSRKLKRGVIGLACAHATKCPYCIRGCVKDGKTDGVTVEQMAEAINVSMVMTAGACYAHSSIAMDALLKYSESSI